MVCLAFLEMSTFEDVELVDVDSDHEPWREVRLVFMFIVQVGLGDESGRGLEPWLGVYI